MIKEQGGRVIKCKLWKKEQFYLHNFVFTVRDQQ